MLADIVIDTNVLVHANNPGSAGLQKEALAFLQAIHGAKTSICVDKPFHNFNAGSNCSVIVHEYIKHVRGNTYSFYLLAALAAANRIVVVGDRVPVATAKKINQCIANRHDRVFVRVAVNSQNSEMASYDFDDFPEPKRKHIHKHIGVQVRTAQQAMALLT